MAVGILSIGMMLVATMFPLAMHLTAVATERTIAAVVADQAFAKIRLFGVVDFSDTDWPPSDPCENFVDFEDLTDPQIDPNEFAYPPTNPLPGSRSQYYWSAICRKVSDNGSDRRVQTIVFVSRKRGAGLTYTNDIDTYDWPVSIKVGVSSGGADKLTINGGDEGLIIPGCTIVDNTTGQTYRVIERGADGPEVATLDRDWDDNTPAPAEIWVVVPPDSGGADPVIAVFQKTIKF